jgi:hypothetical protein
VADKAPNAKVAKPGLLQQIGERTIFCRDGEALSLIFTNPNIIPRGANMNLQIGQHFPEFELPDQDGQIFKLSEAVGKFPFILSFYRGYW